MFISFFRDLSEWLKKQPVKKRVASTLALALVAAAVVFGTGPLLTYAAQTATGAPGSASGVSYKAGDSAFGVVEPAIFVATPMPRVRTIRASGTENADYQLLMDASETSATVMIPDANEGWMGNGNNSNWWLRDGNKNFGRDCSRYNSWMIKMNTTNMISSSAAYSGKEPMKSYDRNTGKYTNWKQFNNIVFCELTETLLEQNGRTNRREIGSASVTEKEFEAIAQTGVYRERIYEFIKDKDKKADTYGYYDFSKLIGMSDKDFKAFIKAVIYGDEKPVYENLKISEKKKSKEVKENELLVKNSQQLWNAITQISRSNSGVYTSHVDRVNMFITDSYNYAITKSDAKAYFKGKKLSDGKGLTLTEEDNTSSAIGHLFNSTKKIPSLERITNAGLNTADEDKCRVYCANMYRMGYLDLLLTGYAIAVNQSFIDGGKHGAAAAAEQWELALHDYLTVESPEYAPVWINLQMGTISIQNVHNKKDGTYQMVFSTSQDSVDASYSLATVSYKTTDEKLADLITTMSYPYPGYPVSGKKDGTMKIGFDNKGTNKSATQIVKRKKAYYGITYYDKLKKASVNGITNGYTWASDFVLYRILGKLYDNGKEITDKNPLNSIELIKSRVSAGAFSGNTSAHKGLQWSESRSTGIWQNIYDENKGNQQMYGSSMIMCAPFEKLPDVTPSEFAFAAKLTISSEVGKKLFLTIVLLYKKAKEG